MRSIKLSYDASSKINNYYDFTVNEITFAYGQDRPIGGNVLAVVNINGQYVADKDSASYDISRGNSSARDGSFDLDLSSCKLRVIPHTAVAALCLLQNVILLVLHFTRKRIKGGDMNYAKYKTVSRPSTNRDVTRILKMRMG